jgi:hypothetical protein
MAVEKAGERVEMLLGGAAARPICIPLGRAEQDLPFIYSGLTGVGRIGSSLP